MCRVDENDGGTTKTSPRGHDYFLCISYVSGFWRLYYSLFRCRLHQPGRSSSGCDMSDLLSNHVDATLKPAMIIDTDVPLDVSSWDERSLSIIPKCRLVHSSHVEDANTFLK
jgi:hypothetical protein